MKNVFLVLAMLLSFTVSAQVTNNIPEYIFNKRLSVGTEGVPGDTTAYLHVGPNGGAVKGLKLPMVTDTAAVAGLKKNGLTIFSVQLNQPVYWDSIYARWRSMGGSSSSIGDLDDAYVYNGLPGSVDTLGFWRNDSTLILRTHIPGYGLLTDATNRTDTTWGLKADTTSGKLATQWFVTNALAGITGDNFANADLTFDNDRYHNAGDFELYIETTTGSSISMTPYLGSGDASTQIQAQISSTPMIRSYSSAYVQSTFTSTDLQSDWDSSMARFSVETTSAGGKVKTSINGTVGGIYYLHGPGVTADDSTFAIFSLAANTNTGAFALAHDTITGQIVRIPMTGGGGGVTTMAAIGSSPNANGATISGSTLNLQPADASFGGVVTTGSQTFAGTKTFTANVRIPYSSFNTYATTTEIASIESANGAVAKLKRGALSRTIYEQAAKTTTYSVTEDDASVFTGDATGGTFDFDLLSASGIAGRTYTFKKIDASANDVVIDGNTTETIDGAATYTLDAQYDFVTITSNGTNWIVTNKSTTAGGSGTVTSVSAGYGTAFTTITATGSVEVDSAAIATRARVQKGIDSVASVDLESADEKHFYNATVGPTALYSAWNRPGSQITGTVALADGAVRYVAVNITKAQTITGVTWWQTVAGDYTADNYNGVGLYSINTSTGEITLVASSTDDGNIWKGAANAYYSKAFSSPYSASVGKYMIAYLYNSSAQTTAPSVGITAATQGTNLHTNGTYKIAGTNPGETTLATPVSNANISLNGSVTWGSVY